METTYLNTYSTQINIHNNIRQNSILFDFQQEDNLTNLPIRYLTFDYLASFIKDDFSFIQQKKIVENLNHIFKKKLNLVPFSNDFNLKEFKLINNSFYKNSEFILQNLLKGNYNDIPSTDVERNFIRGNFGNFRG